MFAFNFDVRSWLVIAIRKVFCVNFVRGTDQHRDESYPPIVLLLMQKIVFLTTSRRFSVVNHLRNGFIFIVGFFV